jgi:hypothetical protein
MDSSWAVVKYLLLVFLVPMTPALLGVTHTESALGNPDEGMVEPITAEVPHA